MMLWLKGWLGHIFLGAIVLDRALDRLIPLWQKFAKAEDFVERRIGERRHITMGIAEILTLIEHGVPAVEAGWAALETQIPGDKADALAAWSAGLKAFSDIKGGLPIIIAAIKAGAGITPAPVAPVVPTAA